VPLRLELGQTKSGGNLVPRTRDDGNSGALSLEPFEMFGLNFQVSNEHLEAGSSGEKKKE